MSQQQPASCETAKRGCGPSAACTSGLRSVSPKCARQAPALAVGRKARPLTRLNIASRSASFGVQTRTGSLQSWLPVPADSPLDKNHERSGAQPLRICASGAAVGQPRGPCCDRPNIAMQGSRMPSPLDVGSLTAYLPAAAASPGADILNTKRRLFSSRNGVLRPDA